MSKTLKIVFFGTPDFAVASLRALTESKHKVVAVVTMPDKPMGRGHKVQPSPIKQFAVATSIPVLQPTNLKDADFLSELKSFKADLFVVVAFRMLPEAVWNMPPLGTLNVHASLLPQYRGAAPINWAIINGEQETGVTIFKLQHAIDTGDVLLRKKIAIDENDTAGSLHDKLMLLGASTLTDAMAFIAGEKAHYTSQLTLNENTTLRKAPKIFKKDCRINWDMPAKTVHNFIRGLSPYPGAWCTLYIGSKSWTLKIFFTSIAPKVDLPSQPGTIKTDGRTYLHIGTADGWLAIEKLQLQGKKRMDIAPFLNGFDIKDGKLD